MTLFWWLNRENRVAVGGLKVCLREAKREARFLSRMYECALRSHITRDLAVSYWEQWDHKLRLIDAIKREIEEAKNR